MNLTKQLHCAFTVAVLGFLPLASLATKGSVLITVQKNGSGSGTVTSKDGGISCGATCTQLVQISKKVALDAVADPGSLFVGWSHFDCAVTKECKFSASEAETVIATFIPQPVSAENRIIYVGICGLGFVQTSCSSAEGWYDPRSLPLLSSFNPLNETSLNTVGNVFSGLDAIGLRIASLYPTSITLVTGFDPITLQVSEKAIAEFVRSVYQPGDLVYLVGHSAGGEVIQSAAKSLQSDGIGVEMTAQIDGVGNTIVVSKNVKRAFNFVHLPFAPLVECVIAGHLNLTAKDPTMTLVTNETIADPAGPDTGYCASHKNMDNDSRVWRPILSFMGGDIPSLDFFDDFNRPDGAVGNGWTDSPDNATSPSVVNGGRLTTTTLVDASGVYRPMDIAKRATVSAAITQKNGFGGLLRAYDTGISFGSTGALRSGYGIRIARSDQLDSHSRVLVLFGNSLLGTIDSTFQFGPTIDVSVTLELDGTLHGTISGDGHVFNFNFNPSGPVALPGTNILIFQSGPDSRSSVLTHSTVDNFSLVHD